MEKVRIQDDLYNYVNGEKIESLVIPDDLPSIGGFTTLHTEVEALMIGEFNRMSDTGDYPDDYLRRACALFAAAKNVEKKAADGVAPLLKDLALIEGLKDMDDFNAALKELVLSGMPLPLEISVETDMKNTKVHGVNLQGPGVILPDASYYKPEMAPQKEALLGIWSAMAQAVLAKSDLSKEAQAQYIQDTLAFDAILGGLVKSQEEWSEYIKAYNPRKTSTVCKMVAPIDLKGLLKDLFGKVPEKVGVAEPRYFKAFATVFNEETFNIYKHWAYVTKMVGSCSLLSEELREIGGTFYRALAGIPAMTAVEKFAYQLASGMYSEPVGLYYGRKYFGEEAKKDITEIVYQIIDTYKTRIQNNPILCSETRAKAILKLSTMGVKMGYPDKVRTVYDSLIFDEGASLYEMVTSLKRIKREDGFSKLYKDVDRTLWAMPGHMVNACYDPFVNDITFPAAILQPPFYALSQTRSENLGGIGAVIGHEISHAFDSNGAKCDENGNINNWWTKEDEKRFKGLIKAMVKQFDGIELPWGKVNGKFIVSENMADNGGMAVTLDIMSKVKNANYEEYFANWARVWCTKAKPEYQKLLLSIDVHGPAILRANMPPRNFDEWYKTFKVKKTDKMYIEPKSRLVIW